MNLRVCLLFSLFVAQLVAIPVSVMMPLNLVSNNGFLSNPQVLQQKLEQLKRSNVDGVMADVWWGIVEQHPGEYNWQPYQQFVQIAEAAGLTVQFVASFHQCGGNVGDDCQIPLPEWVLEVGESNRDIFYTDQHEGNTREYLSLGADNEALFDGRTPVQMYSDFMLAMASNFSSYMPHTVNQIQVGLGPAGEMRYPSYQLQDNKWTYCGIGEFQSYDSYMMTSLAAAAEEIGHSDWGTSGPNNAGDYNSHPSGTGFFSEGVKDNYASDYGKFFLGWYSQQLLNHGDAILEAAKEAFGPLGLTVAAKISGVHWWYNSPSHAAEVTAGYLNTNGVNAYEQIAEMFAKTHTEFDFTCLEMFDDSNCNSGPQQLVAQAIQAANNAGIEFSGENALPVCFWGGCNQAGFDQIYKQSTQFGNIARFTYLRYSDPLFDGNNWNTFSAFVDRMANA